MKPCKKLGQCAKMKKIWVSIDETTDSSGRKVGNVVVGVLKNDKVASELSFLVKCKELPAANHVTIVRLFNETMHMIWPNGIKYDNVLLFLSDGAPYMRKAGEVLSVSFSYMIHVTCVVHALHRLCEFIRLLYPNVDKLVSNGKNFFLKSPSRIDLFREKNPDLPLPPAPVITRWGTWLSAVLYYGTNFESFASVVNELNKNDASSIEIVQDLLKDDHLKNDLAFISANLNFLCDSITKLETSTNLLSETVKEVQAVEMNINSLPGLKVLKDKFKNLFEKNNGFKKLCIVAQVLEGIQVGELHGVSISDIPLFKYARLTSCDVERSFSQYKALFRDNRHAFVMEN